MRRHRTGPVIGAVAVAVVTLVVTSCASGGADEGASATSSPASDDGAVRAPGEWAGDYQVRGTNPTGARYRGTLEIEGEPTGVLSLNWDTNGSYNGVGIADGSVLAAAHGDEGDICNAAAFTIAPDGSLAARWASFDGRGPSTEDAIEVIPGPEGLTGSYAIEGVNPDGDDYSGSMDLIKSGQAFEVVRQVGGILVRGSAIRADDVLALAFGGDTCAVVAYRQGPDGRLDGTWGAAGVRNPGLERATPD